MQNKSNQTWAQSSIEDSESVTALTSLLICYNLNKIAFHDSHDRSQNTALSAVSYVFQLHTLWENVCFPLSFEWKAIFAFFPQAKG